MLDFFALKPGDKRGTMWLRTEADFSEWSLLRGESGEGGYVFTRKAGKTLFDFVNSSLVIIVLISRRAADALAKHRITGWKFLPVEVDVPGAGDYGILQISGRAKGFDKTRMRSETRGGFRHFQGLAIREGDWDGQDLFLAGRSGMILATQRVKKVITESELTNFEFTPASQATLIE